MTFHAGVLCIKINEGFRRDQDQALGPRRPIKEPNRTAKACYNRDSERSLMKPTRRLFWFTIAAVTVGAVAGGLYGPRVHANPVSTDDSDVQANLNNFTKIYNIVEREYADKVDPNKAIYGPDSVGSVVGAIPGMLR